jgi:mono/diheme cytochrome c family protein
MNGEITAEVQKADAAMLVKSDSRRTPRSVLLLAASVLIAPAFSAVAQEGGGDAANGHRLAASWCSNCHVVDRATKTGTSTGAPPFPAVAQMKSVTPLSLRVFLQSPHQRMPDLHLSRDETDDLISYILSLREK